MRLLRWLTLLGALGLAAPAVGCRPVKAPPQSLDYAENAKAAYDQALDAFFDRDWENARLLFEEVKRNYGYSRWARLAELRIADIEFHQEKYPEAIGSYKAFVDDFPNDPEVPYARYKIAKALFEQAGPALLLGPLEERDLAVVTDAYSSVRSFLEDYGDHRHEEELRYILAVVTGTLARHELYVARFYRDRGNFEAAVQRIQFCLREYPDSGLSPEGMVLLGETYMMKKDRRAARTVLSRVLVQYPESAFTRPARGFLAMLGGPDPTVKPEPARVPGSGGEDDEGPADPEGTVEGEPPAPDEETAPPRPRGG